MNSKYQDGMLPPDIDDQLSRLLYRWADEQRLTAAQADTVRRAILATSVELGYAWWQEWMKQMSATLRRASTAAKAGITALQTVEDRMSHFVPGWGSAQPTAPNRYTPYLRLR